MNLISNADKLNLNYIPALKKINHSTLTITYESVQCILNILRIGIMSMQMTQNMTLQK